MMHTEEFIKKEILNFREVLQDSPYPEDVLNEFADSLVPIYYSDILADWTNMPSEFENAWRDFLPLNDETTIFQLMAIDLHGYYTATVMKIYQEVKESFEDCEKCQNAIEGGNPFSRFCDECLDTEEATK